jgi:hypothetical protein
VVKKTDQALLDLRSRLSAAYAEQGPRDHRKLAQLENEAHALLQDSGVQGGANNWLAREFGVHRNEVDARRAVYVSGAAAECLWRRVDHAELGLTTAGQIAVTARKESKQSERNIDEIAERLIGEHIKFRSTWSYRRSQTVAENRRRARMGEAPQRRRVVARANDTAPHSAALSKQFKADLVMLVGTYLRQRLEGLCDPSELRQMIDGAATDVEVVCDEVVTKATYRKTNPQPPMGVQRVSRAALARSCEMIGARSPTQSAKLDLDEAKRCYRKMSARYHPDKTNGDERLTAQYRAVQQAWKTIEQWNEENRP